MPKTARHCDKDAAMSLEDLGLAPLPENAPDWQNVRDSDPDYDAVSREMARMSSMTESASSPPNWQLIVDHSAAILGQKSKDIQIATYMAVGLLHTSGLPGLADSVKILADIFATHSDSAFPPRKRARVNAVNWWHERTENWLGDNSGGEIEEELAERLVSGLASLDTALQTVLEDSAPVLSGLKAIVNRIPVKPKPPAKEEEPAEEITVETVETGASAETAGDNAASPFQAAAQAAKPATPASAAAAAQSQLSPEEARKNIQTLLAQCRDIGNQINDASDYLPYRLRRWASWALLKLTPPAEAGRTMLEPPEPHIIQSLNSQLDSGNYQAALAMAEEQVGVYLFWLDPHRVAANALSALGAAHQAALNAVQEETLAFVKRLPGVTKLAFADGTPFADARTKTWLNSLDDNGGGGGGDLNPAVKAALDKAKEKMTVNPEEALDILAEAASAAGRPRDAMLVRIGVLKVFSTSGRREAVLAQITPLLDLIEKHRLEEWDPQVTALALAAAISGLDEEQDAELLTTLRQRLARTAPAQYLRHGS